MYDQQKHKQLTVRFCNELDKCKQAMISKYDKALQFCTFAYNSTRMYDDRMPVVDGLRSSPSPWAALKTSRLLSQLRNLRWSPTRWSRAGGRRLQWPSS